MNQLISSQDYKIKWTLFLKIIASFLLVNLPTLAYREMKRQTKQQKSTPDTYIQYKNSMHQPKNND